MILGCILIPMNLYAVTNEPNDIGLYVVTNEPNDIGLNVITNEPNDIGLYVDTNEVNNIGLYVITNEPIDIGLYHILILVLPLILDLWPSRINQFKKSCPALRSETHVEG